MTVFQPSFFMPLKGSIRSDRRLKSNFSYKNPDKNYKNSCYKNFIITNVATFFIIVACHKINNLIHICYILIFNHVYNFAPLKNAHKTNNQYT